VSLVPASKRDPQSWENGNGKEHMWSGGGTVTFPCTFAPRTHGAIFMLTWERNESAVSPASLRRCATSESEAFDEGVAIPRER
jgi:hypothetical protein